MPGTLWAHMSEVTSVKESLEGGELNSADGEAVELIEEAHTFPKFNAWAFCQLSSRLCAALANASLLGVL